MASTITNLINTINVTFPVAGQDNDSEGFRTNFNIIHQSLLATEGEIEALQGALGSSAANPLYTTATHLVAIQDLRIGNDLITVDSQNNLVVSAGGLSGTLVTSPTVITVHGAFGLTESVTGYTTGTFAVDSVASIEIGATVGLTYHTGTVYTVTHIDPVNNYITVTPEFTNPAFHVGDPLSFLNPFLAGQNVIANLQSQIDALVYTTGHLGLGSISSQNANSVAITGGTINGVSGTNPSLNAGHATTADAATNAADSAKLNGQSASYYQTALGFTPVQQGGGTSMLTNKVKFGWSSSGLLAQVDDTALGSLITSSNIGSQTVSKADAASGGSFFTSGVGSENDIGAALSGYASAYLFNDASGWGLYSAAGGTVLKYTRSSESVTLNGIVVGSNAQGTKYIQGSQPGSGVNGDIWYQI